MDVLTTQALILCPGVQKVAEHASGARRHESHNVGRGQKKKEKKRRNKEEEEEGKKGEEEKEEEEEEKKEKKNEEKQIFS